MEESRLKIAFEIDEEAETAHAVVEEQRYRIDFDADALILFYELCKVNPALDPAPLIHPKILIGFFWCGLQRFHPAIEIGTVKSWYNLRTATAIYEGLWKAFKLWMPEKKQASGREGVEDPSQASADGLGGGSGSPSPESTLA